MANTYDRLVNPKFQAFDSNGVPLSGGKLFSYETGTTTKKTTYSTPAGTANTNPIVLNSRGEATVCGSGYYTFGLYPATETADPPTGSAIWTQDNILLSTDVFLTLKDDTTTGAVLTSLGHTALAQVLIANATVSAYLDDLDFTTLTKALAATSTMGAWLTALGISAPIQTFLDDATIQAARVTLGITAAYSDLGTTNAYVITPSPAITSYVGGMRFLVMIGVGNTNTGACTLNVNGLGATSIKLAGDVHPAAGQLVAGQLCDFVYDGNFQLLNPVEPHNFATGSYTGDAAATKAVTGVGFRPIHVAIFGANTMRGYKTDTMGTYALAAYNTMDYWAVDLIISLDADGFTVGDGTGTTNAFNANGNVYHYVCKK
uniref:Uncharacterized protein n=1 Tax=viral metagenome TaxID=1070528 RepID=A0A6M3XRK7_9ZZZZ